MFNLDIKVVRKKNIREWQINLQFLLEFSPPTGFIITFRLAAHQSMHNNRQVGDGNELFVFSQLFCCDNCQVPPSPL